MADTQEPELDGPGKAEDTSVFNNSRRQQKQSIEVLKSADEQFQDFVYIVSHDLGSPLFSIQAFGMELSRNCEQLLALLEASQAEKTVKEEAFAIIDKDMAQALNYIRLSVDEMKRLLDGLKRVSRVGSAALHIEPLDMNGLIRNLLDSVKAHIEKAGATVTVDKLPRCLGDATLINQVFSNLLCNSIKFLDKNRKGLIHIRGTQKPGRSIYSIEDNGIGIDTRHYRKIFEVFWRLNGAATDGEGVGLAIVQRVLDRHNGQVWLKSELGKGSTFFVSLPAVPGTLGG